MTEMHHDSLGDIPSELWPVFDGPRHRYRNVSPPPVAPTLSAFMAMSLTNEKGDLPVTAASNANEPASQVVGLPNWRTTLKSNKERVMSAIAAFIGTTIGKVVLGTAIAAASVGTGQVVGVLQVPGLPNGDAAPAVETEHDSSEDDAAEVPDCSDQAEAIEQAADGLDDVAEDAASEEADSFEDACDEAAEVAEDTESDDDDSDDVEPDDDFDDGDEVDGPDTAEDDADEAETDADDADGPDDETDTDEADEADEPDEADEADTAEDDIDEVETDADDADDGAESSDIDD